MQNPAVLVLTFLLSATSVVNAEEQDKPSSICDAGSTVYFSCTTKNSKIISFCGNVVDGKIQNIYYRFGRKNKIELEYPHKPTNESLSLFRYNSYGRAQVNYYEVSFQNKGFRYTLGAYYSEEEKQGNVKVERGVSVYNPPESLTANAVFNCTPGGTDRLYLLKGAIQCDEENALGCGN